MTTRLNFFTDEQVAYLNEVVDSVVKTRTDRPRGETIDPIPGAPDNYIVKIPDASTSIPARSGTTLGSLADCEVYKLDTDGELTIASGVKIKVWNPYLCKLYRQAQPFFQASRNKYGLWICEKPRLWHKAKVSGADIAINSSGTCNLWFNGAVSTGPETVTAYLNWMHGSQLVSDAKEIMVHFAEDENKWWISNAECETA